MASMVSSEQSATEAALAYLADQHPSMERRELALLKLEQGWLVQAAADAGDGDHPSGRIVLLVNRHGFVEEVGRNMVSRQSAHRCLVDLTTGGASEHSAPAPAPATARSWSGALV